MVSRTFPNAKGTVYPRTGAGLSASSFSVLRVAVLVPAQVEAPRSRTGFILSTNLPKIRPIIWGVRVKITPAKNRDAPVVCRAWIALGPAVKPTQAMKRFSPRWVKTDCAPPSTVLRLAYLVDH